MVNCTDYIIRHTMRIFAEVDCMVLRKNLSSGIWDSYKEEKVVIPVDAFIGSQDPYVFNKSWLYGYCHNYSIKKDTTPKSVFTWGAWNKQNTSFLCDMIFVQDKRYGWLGGDGGYEPSDTFKQAHPYKENDCLFLDFICHRSLHGEHPKAKFILEAKAFDPGNFNIPTKKTESFFSFIPLYDEGGIFYLVDILPLINEYDFDFHKNFAAGKNKSGVRNIDYITSIIRYIYEKSNCMVVEVLKKGAPSEVNTELQNKYYPLIYGCEFVENKMIECNSYKKEEQD